MSNPQEEDFRYTIFDQTFEPSVTEMAHEETNIRVVNRFAERREYRSEAEQDAFLVETIEKAERRLITLRYLQAVRGARASDPGWLRKTLGWTKR